MSRPIAIVPYHARQQPRPGTYARPSRRLGGGWARGRHRSGRVRRTAPDRGWPRRCRYGCRSRRQSLAADLEVGRQAAVAELVGAFEPQTLPRCSSSAARGFSLRRRSSSGKRRRASTVLPIKLVVVSWPAFSRKMQFCNQLLMAQTARRRLRHGSTCPARRGRRPGACGVRPRGRRDRPRIRPRPRCRRPGAQVRRRAPARLKWRANSGGRARASPGGTPSMSQITSTGSRKAKSSTRSMRPLSACWAKKPVDHGHDARLQEAKRARGVKAAAKSLRTRVCSGGSLNTRLVVWWR